MQPGQERIHAYECEQYKTQCDNGEYGHALPVPLQTQALVQVDGVNNPCN